MSILPVKQTRKMVAQAGFIRCHPWRSPFRPAEAVQIFSRKICGKADLNLKPAFMARRDESAVLACMAYVDLNPIRAMMDTTPETSKHTSIKQRIHCLIKGEQPKNLMRFVGNPRQNIPKGMAYSLIDYCELVDCTGRCIREDKAGYIEQHHSPILARIGLDSEQCCLLILLVDLAVIEYFITFGA
jgi:hypothetical protein